MNREFNQSFPKSRDTTQEQKQGPRVAQWQKNTVCVIPKTGAKGARNRLGVPGQGLCVWDESHQSSSLTAPFTISDDNDDDDEQDEWDATNRTAFIYEPLSS